MPPSPSPGLRSARPLRMSRNLCLRRAVQATSCNGRHLAGGLRCPPPARQHATAAAASTMPIDAPQTLDTELRDLSASEKKNRERLERIVRKHLEHLSDPWKIAQYVEQTLSRDRFDEALLLTQKASRDGQVVVAWNHLINYQLVKDRIKPAIQLYNEMKKRGQLPNVQTFTIIFRGCARSQHPKLAIAEAMKHYNILLSHARLQPNSIHLNAVLNVCARAGDLDSLFLAAESINDSTRAPTAYTYTTILNALRHHAVAQAVSRDLPPQQQAGNVQRAVDRAKSIWAEVVDRWRRGRLVIDEELVCAMGRVLLLSRGREEKRAVLDLLQQTMNIPNLARAGARSDGDDDHDDGKLHGSTDTQAVVSSSAPASTSTSIYAVPGRNTLALVLTILASARLTTCGIKYWNLMVRHHGIVPDSDNWLRLLGMLKVASASAHAASVLDLLPDAHAGPKPFRIAMETCVRDNINVNAVANADRVLDAMLRRLPVPDCHALRLYLRVSLVAHHHLRERAQRGGDDALAARRLYGEQIAAALARLWEPYKKAHYHRFRLSRDGTDGQPDRSYNDKREVVALARHMFSAFNKVINERMLPDQDLRKLRPVGAKINREIQAFYSHREQMEPRLRRHKGSQDGGQGKEEGEEEQQEGEEGEEEDVLEDERDDESPLRHGGDFIWNTTRPVRVISRHQRRQNEARSRSQSTDHSSSPSR